VRCNRTKCCEALLKQASKCNIPALANKYVNFFPDFAFSRCQNMLQLMISGVDPISSESQTGESTTGMQFHYANFPNHYIIQSIYPILKLYLHFDGYPDSDNKYQNEGSNYHH
jgi:hypothetical protein